MIPYTEEPRNRWERGAAGSVSAAISLSSDAATMDSAPSLTIFRPEGSKSAPEIEVLPNPETAFATSIGADLRFGFPDSSGAAQSSTPVIKVGTVFHPITLQLKFRQARLRNALTKSSAHQVFASKSGDSFQIWVAAEPYDLEELEGLTIDGEEVQNLAEVQAAVSEFVTLERECASPRERRVADILARLLQESAGSPRVTVSPSARRALCAAVATAGFPSELGDEQAAEWVYTNVRVRRDDEGNVLVRQPPLPQLFQIDEGTRTVIEWGHGRYAYLEKLGAVVLGNGLRPDLRVAREVAAEMALSDDLYLPLAGQRARADILGWLLSFRDPAIGAVVEAAYWAPGRRRDLSVKSRVELLAPLVRHVVVEINGRRRRVTAGEGEVVYLNGAPVVDDFVLVEYKAR